MDKETVNIKPAVLFREYCGHCLCLIGGKKMELQVKHLCKFYNRRKEALRDINFTLHKGTYGLLGENGAGKSTLMRIMTTVDFPTKGEINYDGENIFSMDEKYRSLIGYMPQNYGVYPSFTARDFLEYMGALKGVSKEKLTSRIEEVLDFVNLSDVADKKVKTFSGGMKRRIGIAQAIINDPPILILDEPTAGLDPNERIRFSNIISDMGKDKIVLLSTHIVSDIEAIASELVVMKKGEILENGNVDEIVQTVNGQVWETVISHEAYQKLRKNRTVIHLKQMEKEVQVRFVGKQYPDVENCQVEPTLEDYYIFAGGINIQ